MLVMGSAFHAQLCFIVSRQGTHVGACQSSFSSRAMVSSNIRSHSGQQSARNRRESISRFIALIALIAYLSLPRTLNPGARRRPSLLARVSPTVASKNGAEGRDRSHENRDTAFHGLPEDFPHQVDIGRTVNPTYAYECDYGHEEGEAGERAQSFPVLILALRRTMMGMLTT